MDEMRNGFPSEKLESQHDLSHQQLDPISKTADMMNKATWRLNHKKRNLPTTNMVDWEHVRSSWSVISNISKTFLLLFLMEDDTVGNPTTNLPFVDGL
jgi:hypothetical protein